MSFLRAIEKGIRRSTLKLLSRSDRIGSNDSLPPSFPDRPRILLIRIDRIGDAIISTPLLRSLRERYPEGRIDLLYGEKNRAVAPLLPHLDNVYMLPKKPTGAFRQVARLRRTRYDAVVNLHLNNSASASLISRLANAPLVVEDPQSNAFAPVADSGRNESSEHVVAMTCRLLKPFGIEPITETNERDHPLELRIPADSILRAAKFSDLYGSDRHDRDAFNEDSQTAGQGKYGEIVLMNISTTNVSRSWPADHVGAAAELLRQAGAVPVICGMPGDADAVREIAGRSGAHALPPLKSYADFAAALAQADAVLTPDTSTVHLAAALGRPTVALYASAQAARAWRPWGVPYNVIFQPDGMETISPEDGAAAVLRLLRRTDIQHEQQPQRTEIPRRSV